MNQEDLKKYKNKLSEHSEEDLKKRDAFYLRSLANGEIQGPLVGYSSIDRQWLKNYDAEKLLLTMPKKSMFEYFRDSVSDNLDLIGVDLRMSLVNDFKTSIRVLKYKQILEEIVTIACGLKEYGLTENDILLEMLPNFIESRESIYAGNGVGSTVYPISPMIPTTKFEEIIKDDRISTVMIYGDFYDKFKEQLDDPSIKQIIYLNGIESFNPIMKFAAKRKDKEGKLNIPNDKRIITWDSILKAGKKYRRKNGIKTYKDFKPYYKDGHIAIIVGTSGTTGIPKGACLTDFAINACDFSEEIPKPFEAGELNLDVLIQSIAYGVGIMHHTMCGGLRNIIIPELITDRTAELIKLFHPDHFSGGPVHYNNIMHSEEFKNGELSIPKNYLSGGASLDKKIEQTLNGNVDETYVEPKEGETKVFVRQGLGSTENTGTGVFTTRGSYKLGSVGIPIALSNCAIFKKGTDEELPVGELGEICMCGPTMMKEYFNNEEETKRVILTHSDGTKWLHLGDEGYMDKDGNVYITDRYKNIFMRNGFNVHPNKIREVILKCPLVIDCCVAGVDHPQEMTVPVAFIVLKEGADKESVKTMLDKMCYNNLEEYYIPYEYVFVKELPMNLGGKYMTDKLIKDNNIVYSEESKSKMNLR